MAMGGDDDVARNGGERGGRSEGSLEQTAQRVSRNLWSDRQSLKSACGLIVCRPLRAVRRRLLEVGAAVAIVAGVEKVHRRTDHRGLGRA